MCMFVCACACACWGIVDFVAIILFAVVILMNIVVYLFMTCEHLCLEYLFIPFGRQLNPSFTVISDWISKPASIECDWSYRCITMVKLPFDVIHHSMLYIC